MSDDAGLDTLVDTLIEIHPAIEALRMPAVDAAYRLMLFELAREIARRRQGAVNDN